jgi:hypothetical protein
VTIHRIFPSHNGIFENEITDKGAKIIALSEDMLENPPLTSSKACKKWLIKTVISRLS